jgi:DegV family protein with EDD domain
MSNTYFYVDTLEYLKRGGRIGKAAAAVGAALRVKPLLTVVDGHVEMLEKTRTTSKALARLRDISVETANRAPHGVDVAVQHIGAAARADELAEQISVHLGGMDVVRIEIGAVVGAHVGPGCVAVTVSPKLSESTVLPDSAVPDSSGDSTEVGPHQSGDAKS